MRAMTEANLRQQRHMNPIDEIRSRLSGHEHILLNEQKDFIEAVPSTVDGFSVSLANEGIYFTVTYDNGWHERIQSAKDALNCFGFGLSEMCRLKIFLAGSAPSKWTVEYGEGDKWIEDSTTGLFFFPYWRERHTIYRQNRITTRELGDEWKVR